MRTLEISQTLHFVEEFSKRVSEARKYARAKSILVVCFISLSLLYIMFNNSQLRLFESLDSSKAKHLEENVQNNSMQFRGIGKATTQLPVGEHETNNSSKHFTTGTMPVKDENKLDDDLFLSLRLFSKESCISRYEYSSYLKNKLYKPSPHLVAKLRSYEKLHARCGPQSVSYRTIISKLPKSIHLNDSKTMTCKYLVWTPANGLGNRMISMASAFLYSLLQNRVFLVEFGADMDGLFCEPFPDSTWLLPKNFPHKNNWGQLPTFENRANSGEYGSSSSFLHINLQYGHGDHNIQHFHCNETLTVLENVPVLILKSDQYFIPSLFMISSFKEELNSMFPKKDAVFHHLGRYLFNPSNEAWGLITRFYQAYLATADEKIGLQIRILNHQNVHTQDILSQVLSCTQNQDILPPFDDAHKGQSFNSTSKSKVVLVASLYPEYAEALRSMYWTMPTVNGDVVGVYQASHDGFQKFGDNAHNLKAWAEIYLLSLCDVIVSSPLSTFGYVAQSLGGLKPWIMVGLGKKAHQNPPCKRGVSMEPCFHFPPQYDCKNITKISDYTHLHPHFKPCVDVHFPPQYDCKNITKISDYTHLHPHFKPCVDVWWGAYKLTDE